MNCPKCNDTCRLKMTGAVCLNTKCNWYTHNVANVSINSETSNLVNLKQFETKPNTFEGTFIKVQNRVMVWQNGVIHVGYVYLP